MLVKLSHKLERYLPQDDIRDICFLLGYLSLAHCLQVLAYSCVYTYYNQETEKMDVIEQQTEALDLHTNTLQILLGKVYLQEKQLGKVKVLLTACVPLRGDSAAVH